MFNQYKGTGYCLMRQTMLDVLPKLKKMLREENMKWEIGYVLPSIREKSAMPLK